MKSLLLRFDSALERFSPGLLASLPGPVSDIDLQALEAGLGFPLPDEIRTLLDHHDGSGQHCVFAAGFPYRMLSAREMLDTYYKEVRLFEARYQERLRERCLPNPEWVSSHPFVDWKFHPSRLSIGRTIMGDSFVWDGLPGGIGAVGQLLEVSKYGELGLAAGSLTEYLTALLDQVDRGLVIWSGTDQEPLGWRSGVDLEITNVWDLLPQYRKYGNVLG
ncbi:MAG: hypothetical protein C4K60_18580 [Ideonella sp. MAG2]|nr:MAG: hypothetical protein C4K60_18580 [Ideonella sp. MAG2]